MHRFPSKTAIGKFRIAALMLFLCYGLFFGEIALLVTLLVTRDQQLVPYAIRGLIIVGAVCFTQWILALQTRCPLCVTAVLASKSCVKSKHAQKFLGSYRLRVAFNVLLKGWFRCPYCNEPSEMKVRERKPRFAKTDD